MKQKDIKLYDLYCWINLQPEIIQKLEIIEEKLILGQIEPYLKRLQNRETAAASYKELKSLLGEDEDHLKMLYCYLECARRIFNRYQEKKIPWTVYIDTMKCFPRFIAECEKKNGRMFFDRGWWTYRQVSMELFRIGELEYQFGTLEGENVIGLHIPSDADLSEGAVHDSLEQAEHFFRTFYPGYQYEKYTCDSWLMSPVLKTLLPEDSHIISFQKRFDIIQVDDKNKEYVEWLFQVPEDTACQEFPEVTSLQKKAKELLLGGGRIGSAYGIGYRPKVRQNHVDQ